MKTTIKVVLLAVSLVIAQAHAGEIVVIGNSNVPRMDSVTIQKVYTGKVISVSGVNVTPVGVKPGTTARNLFLQEFLNQDEEKYTAYWTVRRYIGKGVPPVELASDADVIHYVQSTPGAVGYIDEADLKPGMNVIARRGGAIGKSGLQSSLGSAEDVIDNVQFTPGAVGYIAGLTGMDVIALRQIYVQ
jgi:ABC-type phosphate transport system substrate-binding protein